jgi:tRNA pseudouridine55 synthase
MSGILSVAKEANWTSHQVVAMVRKRTGVRKVGHAGTLDPAAKGVLLICLGQAVRITEYLMDLPKEYRARVVLGRATDTEDNEGETLYTGDVRGVTEAHLQTLLNRYVGGIEQVPPQYSAVKVNGRRAYRLARDGQDVVLRPRLVRVDRMELLGFEPPFVEVNIQCGRGTYIRSLARDLGRDLGCGAHLGELTRTRIGPFAVSDAVGLENLEIALKDGTWTNSLLPMDSGLAHLPAVTLDIDDENRVRRGVSVAGDLPEFHASPTPTMGQVCRAYGQAGSFIAILDYDDQRRTWKPHKVFSQTGS